jgi:hypothetical protein
VNIPFLGGAVQLIVSVGIAFFASFAFAGETQKDPIVFRTFTVHVDQVLVDRKTNKPIHSEIQKTATLPGRSIRFYDRDQHKAYDVSFYDIDTSYPRVPHYSLLRSWKESTDEAKIFHFHNYQERMQWTGASFRPVVSDVVYLVEENENDDSTFKSLDAKNEAALLVHTDYLEGGVEKSVYKTQNAYVPTTAEIAMTSNTSTYTMKLSTREVVTKSIDPKTLAALTAFEQEFTTMLSLESDLKACKEKQDSNCQDSEKAFNEKAAQVDAQFIEVLKPENLPRPKSGIRPQFSRKHIGQM